MEEAFGQGPGLSFLERSIVGNKVQKEYKMYLTRFVSWADPNGERLEGDDAVHAALVRYMNAQYFRGH